MNFDEILEKHDKDSDTGSRLHKTATLGDLERRLEYYAKHSEGFEITDEHRDAFVSIFAERRHTFVTGGAGVGKTAFVTTLLVPEMNHRGINFALTASTGIAGSHISGRTMHSYFGVGQGPKWEEEGAPNPQELTDEHLYLWYEHFYQKWLNDRSIPEGVRNGVRKRLANVELVLIDEISMANGDGLLGYIEYIMRQVRADPRPFGGCQMVFLGDFAQIPPVEKRKIPRPDWAFLSRAWQASNVKTVELTKIFRQGDEEFITFLNQIRLDEPYDRDYVRQFVDTDLASNEKELQKYARLMPHNKDAVEKNIEALQHYPGPTYTLDAEYHMDLRILAEWERRNPEKLRKELKDSLGINHQVLYLRVGCPVMFTVNHPDGLYVNGTRGFVREIKIDREREPSSILDAEAVVVGIRRPGDEEERLITVSRKPYSKNNNFDLNRTTQVAGEDGFEDVYRFPQIRQFPLIPATAITIHKSQGMSMDWAVLSLTRSFAPGQVYVALSRLRGPEGLKITDENFTVEADKHVLAFYRNLREERSQRVPGH